jgi:hypothetical protein
MKRLAAEAAFVAEQATQLDEEVRAGYVFVVNA